ncbi:DUF1311 domain-containing protein [Bacillus sp. DX1.1]|uniref:lysozyme inhibitor LprI family protein n=1 Tax=unclassified Bacillus (in: firmicutes) TaxID=185979 RepID=UPI0025702673|nr:MULTISPECIES: lysozyme inhibitor LprI family protein [unclassified Bacillus (in: firmicutes)]MDM5156064.1 DUF1311 domain-containing protein [Bacillus sp. DX1.1]WJE80353.1 DUF1311 domain-containing protein [Bacillus sp. DX3.1]
MKKALTMMLLCLTASMLMAGCGKNNDEAQGKESTVKTDSKRKVEEIPKVTEEEAKKVLKENINEIVQSFDEMEKENGWSRNNPGDLETVKDGLKAVISEQFAKNQLSRLLETYNASRDTDMQPFPIYIEPEMRFAFVQEKEKLKIDTLVPANDMGNPAETWEFHLIYKDSKWLMDKWSFDTEVDLNLTKEEAEKFLHIIEFKDITFIKEDNSNHKNYIFKVNGQTLAVNAATSVIKYGYEEDSGDENQEQEESNQEPTNANQNDSSNNKNQETYTASGVESSSSGLSKTKFLNELSALEKQEKHSGLTATMDIANEIGDNSQLWDDKLNEIYRVLKDNMPAAAFETMKAKQIEWIKLKENRIDVILKDPNNGTMRYIDAAQEKYTMTKERCYELVNSYMS